MNYKNELSEELLREWRNAVYNSANGYHKLVEDFKQAHEEEYKLITSMYRKRTALRDCTDIMRELNEPIYWFTLTFKNDKDANKVETKRKEAERFLNRLAACYVLVEEYGEDNDRYHLHGFLVFKYGYGFLDWQQWHSRQKLEEISGYKLKTKIKYLTKYAVKSVPRIRRSKTMSQLCNFYNSHKGFKRCFPELYLDKFHKFVANTFNPF